MKFSVLEMGLSHRCNLDCGFCYERSARTGEPADLKRAEAAVDWFLTTIATERPRIVLCLGEPTMEWEILVALVRAYDTPKWEFITNMTLLDAAKIDWCAEHRVTIYPSIDGCPEAQGTHRILDNVYENARALLSHRPSVTCRSTITPQTVRWMSKSLFYLVNEVGFVSVAQALATGRRWTDGAIRDLEDQIRLCAEWWIEKMRAGQFIRLKWLCSALRSIWNPRRQRLACGAGINTIAVDIDGRIWPCHRFCNPLSSGRFLLGTTTNHISNHRQLERMQTFDVARAQTWMCSDCPAVNACSAFCWHEAGERGVDAPIPATVYCRALPMFYREAMRAHALLDAEENETYLKAFGNENRRGDETT